MSKTESNPDFPLKCKVCGKSMICCYNHIKQTILAIVPTELLDPTCKDCLDKEKSKNAKS